MSNVSNPFQACSEIYFKPTAVFSTLAQKHNWSWIPFILVSLLALLPSYYYFNFVDFTWYQDLIINSNYANVSPAEQTLIRNSMSPAQMQSGTVAFGFFALLIINAIIALYLNLMTKSDEQNLHGFTDWYGFAWWVSMPSVLTGLIALLIMLASDNQQLSPLALAPTSLAYWFNVSLGSAWFNLAQGVNLETLWSIALTALGLQQWTRLSRNKAIIIAAAPSVVILGGWSLILLLG